MITNCIRNYKKDATLGNLYINGEFFGHTLEDIPRPYGVKYNGETCIPEGVYNLIITYSNRFKRPMPLLYTESSSYKCDLGGIAFEGIRIHGGNTIDDTEGCPLLGRKTDGIKSVWNCASLNREFINIIEEYINKTGKPVLYVISSVSV